MIKLDTPRLHLIPLEYQQLIKYGRLDKSLEPELGVKPGKRYITIELQNTINQYLIPYINTNPSYLLFATIWVMIFKEENIIIGDIGFNAGPSEKGVIEVGYSTYHEYSNQGFMSEALEAMCNWAFSHQVVKTIIAQTDKDNVASQKVLINNHFEEFADADQSYWWRLDKNVAEIN